MTGGAGPELRTARLLLRRWRETDREPFARLNADPVVMEHFPGRLERHESDAFIDRIEAFFETHGYGLWAVEVPGIDPFIGFVGLSRPRFETHFTPCVEIGWRLESEHWGRGYAPEAATEVLRFAFDEVALDEVVSFTTVANDRSQRVMEKIGMRRNPDDDFEHPGTPGWHGQRHVLYRLRADRWRTVHAR